MRLIDADALMRDIEHYHVSDGKFQHWVEVQPTIETERKKGKWIDYTEYGYVECPFCKSATNCDGNKDELHFCFSCGADMREEEHTTEEFMYGQDMGSPEDGSL